MPLDFSNIKFDQLINSKEFIVNYDVQKALLKEGLKLKDYIEICKRLNRPPNRTELGMFGVMWSEHCCYRNSRSLLKDFPTEGPHVLVGPGENAGVVDLGQGQRLAFKIESHNHPSAIEPFQGAATGVGGILRDIFTMGARPIALLNALRFGPLEEEKNIGLLKGVVAGIAHYGNCIGVPTIGGEVVFDKSYSGNPLVNAMALGLMETEDIVCSGAQGIGFPVVYVGSTTGRDGMGGASFASAELTNTSMDDRPAVQVGDPFLEKGLIEACLEAFKNNEVIAAQDMGAAGLTCSTSEMAAKGEVGIELDLDCVPAREPGMSPYEFLLSESQERMLFIVKPGYEKNLEERFLKWGLYVSVVGKVIKEKVVRVIHNGKIVANLPSKALADDTPVENHLLLTQTPEDITSHWKWHEKELSDATISGIQQYKQKTNISWDEVILKLLEHPSIASKRWVFRQYDYQVQANTLIPPGIADAAVVRLRPQEGLDSTKETKRGIAAVVDCPNRWVYLDPYRGSMAAVVEAARNISCVGAKPLAITDNLNFPSPETKKGFWQLASSCKGLSHACKALETPVTGGNVSLYNETKDINNIVQPIHPTPVIGMVGLVEDTNCLCNILWKNEGDLIYLLGLGFNDKNSSESRVSLSATSYLEYIHGLITGRPPEIDLSLEKTVQSYLRYIISLQLINSAHDVSDGGIAIALAESSVASKLGLHCDFPLINQRLDHILFAEGGGRILISLSPAKQEKLNSTLNDFNIRSKTNIQVLKIGTIINNNEFLITQNNRELVKLPVTKMKNHFENSIQSKVEYQSA